MRMITIFFVVIGILTMFNAFHEIGHFLIAKYKDNATIDEMCFLGINFRMNEKKNFFTSSTGWTTLEIEEDKKESKWHDYLDLGIVKEASP